MTDQTADYVFFCLRRVVTCLVKGAEKAVRSIFICNLRLTERWSLKL